MSKQECHICGKIIDSRGIKLHLNMHARKDETKAKDKAETIPKTKPEVLPVDKPVVQSTVQPTVQPIVQPAVQPVVQPVVQSYGYGYGQTRPPEIKEAEPVQETLYDENPVETKKVWDGLFRRNEPKNMKKVKAVTVEETVEDAEPNANEYKGLFRG